MRDRTVHASYRAFGHLVEIVRYDRAGKWFIECGSIPTNGRVHLTVTAAAAWAKHGMENFEGSVTLGLHGGSAFDRLVQSGNLSEAR